MLSDAERQVLDLAVTESQVYWNGCPGKRVEEGRVARVALIDVRYSAEKVLAGRKSGDGVTPVDVWSHCDDSPADFTPERSIS